MGAHRFLFALVVPRLFVLCIEYSTLLLSAVKDDNYSRVFDLLEAGMSPNVVDTDGETALLKAVRKGSVKMAELLLQKGSADFVNEKNSLGLSCLHLAVIKENEEMVRTLIKYGANVNTTDEDLNTPVHETVFLDNASILCLLCVEKADLNARNNVGLTALAMAIKNHRENLVRILIRFGVNIHDHFNDFNDSPLFCAVCRGSECMTRLLLANGASPNLKDEKSTVLHTAAACDKEEVMRALLEYEVNTEVADIEGDLALHVVVRYGNKSLTKLLLTKGADVDGKNVVDGTLTPLDIAIEENKEELVHILISFGADLTKHRKKTLLRRFWNSCYEYAKYTYFVDIDDYVWKMTLIFLEDNGYKMKSGQDVKMKLEAYENCEVFALYRILKSKKGAFHKSSGRSLENEKCDIFSKILNLIFRGTYLSKLQAVLLSDVIFCAHLKWNLERWSWYLTLACYKGSGVAHSTQDSLKAHLFKQLKINTEKDSEHEGNNTQKCAEKFIGSGDFERIIFSFRTDGISCTVNEWNEYATKLLQAKGILPVLENAEDLMESHTSAVGNHHQKPEYDPDVTIEGGALAFNPVAINNEEGVLKGFSTEYGSNLREVVAYDINFVLHDIVRRGKKSLVKLLLIMGADVNEENRDNLTPLDIAIGENKEELVHVLISFGANLSNYSEKTLFKKFWNSCYVYAFDATFVNFDEYVLQMTRFFLKDSSHNTDVKTKLALYENRETFALYRILKCQTCFSFGKSADRTLEDEKSDIFSKILIRIFRGTYLSKLQEILLSDVVFSAYLKWNLERWSWYLTLACYKSMGSVGHSVQNAFRALLMKKLKFKYIKDEGNNTQECGKKFIESGEIEKMIFSSQ